LNHHAHKAPFKQSYKEDPVVYLILLSDMIFWGARN